MSCLEEESEKMQIGWLILLIHQSNNAATFKVFSFRYDHKHIMERCVLWRYLHSCLLILFVSFSKLLYLIVLFFFKKKTRTAWHHFLFTTYLFPIVVLKGCSIWRVVARPARYEILNSWKWLMEGKKTRNILLLLNY